jgi:hypothetical protein
VPKRKANATAFRQWRSLVAGGGFEPPTFRLCDLTHLSMRVGLYLTLQRSQIPANANNSPPLTSKQKGCLAFPLRIHSYNPSAGIKHPRAFNASRNAGFVAAVSDLALIIRAATEGFDAHDGISPHFISVRSRTGSLGFWREPGFVLAR